MREIYESLSQPNLGPTSGLVNLIIHQTGTSVVRRALQSSESAINANSTGLVRLLEKVVEAPSNVFWHPIVGLLRTKLTEQDSTVPLKWFVEIGCIAHLAGISGSWNFHFEEPQRLWIGRWLLPEIVGGAVHGDANEICVLARTSGGQLGPLKLLRDKRSHEWNVDQLPQDTFELPAVDLTTNNRLFLMPAKMLDDELLPEFPGAQFQEGASLNCFGDTLKKAAELLSRHAPEYLSWVARVVKFVAPFGVPAGIVGSSSSAKYSGLVCISDDPRALTVAELLVHEASHQYFFLAKCLGTLHEHPEEQLFFSRIAQRERPIERILLAYHALGNMLLFYNRCLAGGMPCDKRMAYIFIHMQQLEDTLNNSDAFTPLGRALWQPLTESKRHISINIEESIHDDLTECERNMAQLKKAFTNELE